MHMALKSFHLDPIRYTDSGQAGGARLLLENHLHLLLVTGLLGWKFMSCSQVKSCVKELVPYWLQENEQPIKKSRSTH